MKLPLIFLYERERRGSVVRVPVSLHQERAGGSMVGRVLAGIVVLGFVLLAAAGLTATPTAQSAPTAARPLVTLTSPPASFWTQSKFQVKPKVKRARSSEPQRDDLDEYLVDGYLGRLPSPRP